MAKRKKKADKTEAEVTDVKEEVTEDIKVVETEEVVVVKETELPPEEGLTSAKAEEVPEEKPKVEEPQVKEEIPVVDEPEMLFTYKPADDLIVKIINNYLEAVKASNIKDAAKALARLFQVLMDKPTANNVAAVISFFRKYNTSLLHDSVGLQGASHLSIGQRAKVEILYKVFKNIVENRTKSMNMDVVRKAIGDALTTEIIKKMKR